MSYKRRFIGMSAAVMAVVAVATPASAENFPGHAPADFVALGDSYAAGQGLDPIGGGGYYDGTDVPGFNMCHRSSLAFGPLLAEALRAEGRIAEDAWLMPACSGDETTHMSTGSGQDFSATKVPQFDSLGSATEYVTLSIGGNDIGFGRIGSSCVEGLTPSGATWGPAGRSLATCRAFLRTAYTMATDGTMQARLLELYRQILQRAPNARLVVATYPRLLPANLGYIGAVVSGRRYCVVAGLANAGVGFRSGVVSANDPQNGIYGINQVETALNRTIVDTVNHIRTADGLAGRISLARLDVGELAEHPFSCGESGHPQEYINGGRATTDNDSPPPPDAEFLRHVSPASFHPNEAGHRAFADAVLPKLQPSAQFAAVVTSSGGRRVTAAEPLRVRLGVRSHVDVDPINGTPTWDDRRSESSVAAYHIGYERLPQSGLDIVEISQPTPGTSRVIFDATDVGTYLFRAVVTDGIGTTIRRRIDVEVVDHLQIPIGDLPAGESGVGYTTTLTVNAALGPLTWSAVGLPPGLALDPTTGEITGTPTEEGGWDVTVTADDTTAQASRTFRLRIGPPTGRFQFPGSNFTAVLSDDGRWLAYQQMQQSNGVQDFDVYLRSTVTGAPPVKLSQNAAGTVSGGAQASDPPGISPDGRFVTFTSWQRLTSADTNNVDDVYRYDSDDGSLVLVPGTSGWRAGPVSQDGRYVLALAPATSALPPHGALWRIDMTTGAAERVDTTAAGGNPNFSMAQLLGLGLSDDGQRVVFTTNATNLDAADPDTLSDIFLKDMTTGAITSLTAGLTDNGQRVMSQRSSLSDDGRLLAFVRTNPASGNTDQVLVDLTTGEQLLLAGGSDGPRLSADGTTVAYSRGHLIPAQPGIGGSPATFYGAAHRATVTTGPLALTDDRNLSLNHDGSEPRVYGTIPYAVILGLSDDGGAVLWQANYGYQMPGVYPGGGFFLHRVARG